MKNHRTCHFFDLSRVCLSFVLAASLLSIGCSDALKKENSELSKQVAKLTTEKAAQDTELAKKQAELTGTHERLADSKTRIEELKQEIATLKGSAASQADQVAELSTRLKESERVQQEQKGDLGRKIAELNAEAEKAKRSEKGLLNGVVTYFFNNNFGYKPDVGAEVLVLSSNAVIGRFDPALLRKFTAVKLALSMKQYPSGAAMAEKTLSEYEITSDNDWKELDRKVAEMLLPLEVDKSAIKLVADGNGTFKRSLAPGSYFVLVRSKHRKNISMAEVLGQISFSNIEVVSGEEVSVNAKFQAY